jgi:hypothetical protein
VLVHHYHPQTGHHLGSSEAHVDPAEHALRQRVLVAEREAAAKGRYALAAQAVGRPAAAGPEWSPEQRSALDAAWNAYVAEVETAKAEATALAPIDFLLPAHATFDAPPAPPEGKAAAYRDGGWTHVDLEPVEAPTRKGKRPAA